MVARQSAWAALVLAGCAAALAAGGCSRKDADRRARSVTRAAAEGVSLASASAAGAASTVVHGAQTVGAVRRELDRVYRSTADYDLVVESEGGDNARMREHEARLAALPHVAVDGVTVGYEESQTRSLRGATYSKHFRATWVHGGRRYGVSYYSNERIDAAAFAQLLQRLVPIVQRSVASNAG